MKYILISIAAFLVFSGAVSPSHAQTFQNLNFENRCESSQTGLCNWDLSWGRMANVAGDLSDGAPALLLVGDKKSDVAFVEQSSTFEPLKRVSVLTLSGEISSDNVDGKGAGLNIFLHDSEGKLLAFKDMGAVYSIDWISGTRGWRSYSISIVCPERTAKIKIGAILFGKGKARFRNYNTAISLIDDRKPSKLAFKYISLASEIIKKNSLVRDSFDVEKMKQVALKVAGDAKQPSDTYLAISYLLESLREFGDFHSFFMKEAEVKNWKSGGCPLARSSFQLTRSSIIADL